MGHKYPLGTAFEQLSSEHVRRVFEANTLMGTINAESFSSCVARLLQPGFFGRLLR